MSQATLGETSETKTINIDQPVPVAVEAPPAIEMIPLAEIDPSIFDDEPVAKERPSRPADPGEFASPIFAKRSRASYGPLFELDLDDEIEDDGGRRGKGRKRPRYSVQNRMWRYREDSSSPEPEPSQHSSSPTPARNGDVEMLDTPTKPAMTDGGCQTNEAELAPHPSSTFNTPDRGWSTIGASSASAIGLPHSSGLESFDAGIQVPPLKPMSTSSDKPSHAQAATTLQNPFGATPNSTYFPLPRDDVGATGEMPQTPTPSTNQGFKNAPSLFGSIPTATSNQSSHGFAQVSAFGEPDAAHNVHTGGSSLFGDGSYQPSFAQSVSAGSGFGAPSGSLRFGFGQESQSTIGTSPYADPQSSTEQPDPYPESYLDHTTTENTHLAEQQPYGTFAHDIELENGFAAGDGRIQNNSNSATQESSPWPMEAPNFGTGYTDSQIGNPMNAPSDTSDLQNSTPGMIPPQVEDGTRNADEMLQQGLLSRPVYRQDVPEGALPDGEAASAGEELAESDDQAYDESERGDDYDLRNYDRVSDDEEGFDEQEQLPDDELMDEGEESFGEEEDFDEDEDEDEEGEDYDEEAPHDNDHQAQRPGRIPQPAPRPSVQKQPIVIDLLSDSDDDDPPAAAPPPQAQQQPSTSHMKSEVEAHPSSTPPRSQEDGSELEEDAEEDEADAEGAEYYDDEAEESLEEDEDASGELEDVDEESLESEHVEPQEHDITRHDDSAAGAADKIVEVREATTLTLNQTIELENNGRDVSEEIIHTEVVTVDEKQIVPIQIDGTADMMDVDEDQQESLSDPAQTQVAGNLELFQSQIDSTTNQASSSLPDAADGNAGKDVVEGEEKAGSAQDEDHLPETSGPKGISEKKVASSPSEQMVETIEEEGGDRSVDGPEALTTRDSGDLQPRAGESGDVPPSPPESQHPEIDDEVKADISMTDVASHVDMQPAEHRQTTPQNQEAQFLSTQPSKDDSGDNVVAQEKDMEMMDASTPIEAEGSNPEPKQAKQLPNDDGEGTMDAPERPEIEPETASDESRRTSSLLPQVEKKQIDSDLAAHESQPKVTRLDSITENEDVQTQSTKETPEEADSAVDATQDDEDADTSFATAASQVSQTPDAEEVGSASADKPKRVGRKKRSSWGSKSAKSPIILKRGQLQISSQNAPSIQRTTRSKTMSFQQSASPREEKEDMSIQLARAALQSPSAKTHRKTSSTASRTLDAELTKRLDNEMPDCVSLKELRKYNSQKLDVAAVVTSAHTPPKRTVTREYASSFTVTDPSLAPEGVVEVDLYSLHRDHLPVVKVGDAILLRSFTVVSLPGRGFGLKTDKDESSWAVFEAGAGDEPQMRAGPVEMNDKETRYLIDLRSWHADLDENARKKLASVVGEVVESGRESRAKK